VTERPSQIVQVEIEGKKVAVGTLGLLMRYRAEEELREIRREIFVAAIKAATSLDKATAESFLLGAYRDYANTAVFMDDELNAWLLSAAGQRWRFRQALRSADPKVSTEEADRLYSVATKEVSDRIEEHHLDWLNPDWREELKRQEDARKQATEGAVIQRWIEAGLIQYVKSPEPQADRAET
jgi:hypothetical protein